MKKVNLNQNALSKRAVSGLCQLGYIAAKISCMKLVVAILYREWVAGVNSNLIRVAIADGDEIILHISTERVRWFGK